MKDEIIRRQTIQLEAMPRTLSEENRSVGVIISSISPIDEFDFSTGEVLPTIIVPEGVEIPSNGQVPLMDTHNRSTTNNVIGSIRNIRVEEDLLVGEAFFASDDRSDRVFSLVKEGHLTDYSIGARVLKFSVLEENQTAEFHGRTFEGPAKIIFESRIKEVSSVPIGADENAKNRADAHLTENEKPEEVIHMSEEDKSKTVDAPIENDENLVRAEEAPKTPEVPEVNTEEIARTAKVEAQAEEKVRQDSLRTIGAEAEIEEEVVRGWVKNDISVEVAREAAYKKMTERNKEMNLNTPNIETVADANEKFRSAVEDGICIRTGTELKEGPSEGAQEMAGYSMTEIAREYLKRSNMDYKGNNMAIMGRALSTSDFPILCGNIAQKNMLMGFDSRAESYETWCDTSGSVSDFKINTSARASEFNDLEEVAEGEEYKYGDRIEQKEEYQIRKYGKLFTITREALINDDLSALADTPRHMGEAAKRLLGDLAYDVLISNPLMGDGTALFDAAHGNLGTPAAIGFAGYDEAETLMGLQKDIKDLRRLNIDPVYYLAPRTIKGASEVFFRTQRYADADTAATRENIHFDAVQRVYDSRLDDASLTGWYVLGPKGKTVKMFFLNGQKTPFFERQDMFKVDGATWKVRIEAVAKAMLWQGMVKNAGV